jgi:glutathione reductase (NADPH)
MGNFDFDLFVIGGGSGGVRVGRMSASFGARVAVAEERYLGGTCVNVGCVPKKLFAYASHFSKDFKDSEGFGWTVGEQSFNWQTLLVNKNKEISRLNGIYDSLLANAGATVIHGHAELQDPHTITVGTQTYTSERIVVATGGWPFVPQIPGAEHAATSNEAFFLESLPRRVVVVGGGYIAVEFAGIFNGLGVDTTQVYRGPLFLRGFDDDLRSFLAKEMDKNGITLLFNTDITQITAKGSSYQTALDNGNSLECDLVMYATGRKPIVTGFGLENCGVEINRDGAIIVDSNYRTNVDSIYAIGDVTNRVNLTPVAIAEGMALAYHLYKDEGRPVDYEYVPSAVFSDPNLGTVGYTEAEAKEKFGELTIYMSSFSPLKHSLSGNDEKTLLKLIVDKASNRVVGAHMIGPDAGETIQGLAVALKAGATKELFDKTIGIHPTSAEEWVTMREPSRSD